MQEKDKLSTRNGAAQLVLMSKVINDLRVLLPNAKDELLTLMPQDETFGEPDLSRIIFRSS